jgi:hypothetical protein
MTERPRSSLRFPGTAHLVEQMPAEPGPLRDMYEELLEAEKGLAAAETAPLELRDARKFEWRLAIEALVHEIERELRDTNVVPIDQGRRRSSK